MIAKVNSPMKLCNSRSLKWQFFSIKISNNCGCTPIDDLIFERGNFSVQILKETIAVTSRR